MTENSEGTWNSWVEHADGRPPTVVHVADGHLISACPSCGMVEARTVYDIGSGPEVSCADCEWCWGAQGQDLKPLRLEEYDVAFFPRRIETVELPAEDQ